MNNDQRMINLIYSPKITLTSASTVGVRLSLIRYTDYSWWVLPFPAPDRERNAARCRFHSSLLQHIPNQPTCVIWFHLSIRILNVGPRTPRV